MPSYRRRVAFTLVELLIVVVILGILATLVIPMFLDAGEDTKLAALTSDLAIVRQAIQIYNLQHSSGSTGGASKTSGTLEEAEAKAAEFKELTAKDLASSAVSFAKEVGAGEKSSSQVPYLNAMPVNPFNNKSDVRIDGDPAGAGTHGWHIDSETGRFSADDSPKHAEL